MSLDAGWAPVAGLVFGGWRARSGVAFHGLQSCDAATTRPRSPMFVPPLRDWPAATMWNGGGPHFLKQESVLLSPGGPCAQPKLLQAEKHNPRHDAVKWDAEKKAKQPDLDQRLRRKAGENDGGLTTRRREKVEHIRVQPWSAASA